MVRTDKSCILVRLNKKIGYVSTSLNIQRSAGASLNHSFLPHFTPQKRVCSRNSHGVLLNACSYALPGKIKEHQRILLVADFEKTQSYSRTYQSVWVH